MEQSIDITVEWTRSSWWRWWRWKGWQSTGHTNQDKHGHVCPDDEVIELSLLHLHVVAHTHMDANHLCATNRKPILDIDRLQFQPLFTQSCKVWEMDKAIKSHRHLISVYRIMRSIPRGMWRRSGLRDHTPGWTCAPYPPSERYPHTLPDDK